MATSRVTIISASWSDIGAGPLFFQKKTPTELLVGVGTIAPAANDQALNIAANDSSFAYNGTAHVFCKAVSGTIDIVLAI